MVAFLGSTIGNLTPAARHRFFTSLRALLTDGDTLLLGADLVKQEGRLIAAYDDAAGVTAEFNRNVLHVLNTSLGADFRPDRFDHVVVWDPDAAWIEMRLRAQEAMQVAIADLGLSVSFQRGEEIRTEISAKFRRAGLAAELAAAGFELTCWWTDPDHDFAVSLSVPR